MSKQAEYALQTQDLTKTYRPPSGVRRMLMRTPIQQEILALDRVNLKVKPGEVFGLLGPNGAGKTTLIKILTTLLRPTSGAARIQGFDVVTGEEDVKRTIGFASGEERSFYWRLTGRHNLEFFAALCGVNRRDIPDRVASALATLGFGDEADNMVYSYSSGMKQKLAIARALLSEPAVLFLDEPTKSVDAVMAKELKRLVKDVLSRQQGRTVVLATHRLEEAEQVCDRVGIMDTGKLLFCGSVEELRGQLGSRDEYEVLTNGVSRRKCEEVAARCGLVGARITRVGSNGHVALRFASQNGNGTLSSVLGGLLSSGGTVVSCEKRERRLEDMFLSLVKGGRNWW